MRDIIRLVESGLVTGETSYPLMNEHAVPRDAVPEVVRQDLIRFTQFAGRKLDATTVAWLKSHDDLRATSPVEVYRGVTIERDDVKKFVSKVAYGKNPLEVIVPSWFGIELSDVVISASVVVRRGKPTSWSREKTVAEDFLQPRNGWGSCYGWLMLHATLVPQNILIDFAKLDVDGLHNAEQSEVVSTSVRIPATVVDFAFRAFNGNAMPGRMWGRLDGP